MNGDKSSPEAQGVVENPANIMAASGPAASPSETLANQHEGTELPPPYSQVPLSAFSSQFPNQAVQQQNVWPSQGYPTFPPPGGPQHPPYQLGGFPPQACAPSANELRLRQESAIRQGIAATVVTQTYRRRSCTYRLARLGIGFLLIGVTILITLGILIVRPAMNDLQLQRAQCKVISSEYTQEEVSCSCGRYCSSHYPCLQIQVAYISAKGKWQTAYLYQDVYDDKNKCSVQPCSSSEFSNDEDVRSFRDAFPTVDESFTCYYNPKTPDEAFKNHSNEESDNTKIMHCILWPMLLVVFSVSMLSILYCRSKGHCCFKKGGSSVPYQDLREQPMA